MNKFYIQIVFFLLSVSVYLSNKTLATESAPEENTKIKSKNPYSTPEELYEKNKHLLCTNPNETIIATKLMNQAAAQLEHHIKHKEGYKPCKYSPHCNDAFCRQAYEGNPITRRINLKYYYPNKYNEIINLLWDPALANNFNNRSVKRKITRVYNPNLVMIQQRYKSGYEDFEKYFYALATKAQISKDKTIIVMTSANIIDHNPSRDEYKNKIIESANLFRTQINSEDDIRSGKLKKTFVNIAGYLIEKIGPYVNITYLESIDGHISSYQELIIEKALNNFFHYKKNIPYENY